MNEVLLHALLPGRDQVTGHIVTRCGIEGPRDSSSRSRPEFCSDALWKQGDMICIADREAKVSCQGCRLRLTPTQKKILRILYDNRAHRSVVFNEERKFDYFVGTNVTFYGPQAAWNGLCRLGFIAGSVLKCHVLTLRGIDVAKDLPVVVDPFDKAKRKKK